MGRKIGALWLRTSNDGKTFMSGVLNDLAGDISIAVFKNDRKEKDNQPDYNIVLSDKREEKPKQQHDNNFFPKDEPVDTHEPPAGTEEIKVEEIPF